ncbi:actin [Gossypium australe]|uniref:Actin n=1 Tax=Gossypium australe TaxID=47621 RepID=A0A5B6X5X7_9ROSI|nr:actin [Gossypium australe]
MVRIFSYLYFDVIKEPEWLDFVRRCSKSRVPWHCGVVHDTRVFICQKDAFVADEAQSNCYLKLKGMLISRGIVWRHCSQWWIHYVPRNCRQNEKGSHGLSIKIKAVASTRKEYSFWIGGSILVSLSTFEQVLSSSDACFTESFHVAYSMLLPFT